MSRTYRKNHDHTKTTIDGYPWRGCGDHNCPWCKSDRENIKIKSKENLKDLEGFNE